MRASVAKVVKATPLSVSFQPEILNKINSFCAERGCSRSWFMNKAAELYLNECLEDMADYNAAVVAFKEWEKGDRKTFSSADLRGEFGL